MIAFACSVTPVAKQTVPRISDITHIPLPTLHVPTVFLRDQAYGHFPQYFHSESLCLAEGGLRDPLFVPPVPPLFVKRLGK